jgi:hypothetical protein
MSDFLSKTTSLFNSFKVVVQTTVRRIMYPKIKVEDDSSIKVTTESGVQTETVPEEETVPEVVEEETVPEVVVKNTVEDLVTRLTFVD